MKGADIQTDTSASIVYSEKQEQVSSCWNLVPSTTSEGSVCAPWCSMAQAGPFFVITNPGHGLSRANANENRDDLCEKTVWVGEESPADKGGGRRNGVDGI